LDFRNIANELALSLLKKENKYITATNATYHTRARPERNSRVKNKLYNKYPEKI